MKISNKNTRAEYKSDTLEKYDICKESGDNKKVCYFDGLNGHTFYEEDGWRDYDFLTDDEMMLSVISSYSEISGRVKGCEYSSVLCDELYGFNFTDELFDVNYGRFCFTICCNEDGGCSVMRNGIEYYDGGGMLCGMINLGIDLEKF